MIFSFEMSALHFFGGGIYLFMIFYDEKVNSITYLSPFCLISVEFSLDWKIRNFTFLPAYSNMVAVN